MQVDSYGRLYQSRRPGMYLALGTGMAVLYLSLTLELNVLVPVLAAIYLALVLYRLIRNPGSGFRLGAQQVDWLTKTGRRSAAFADIASVSIGRGADGKVLCVLNMKDGSHVRLSGVERVTEQDLMREFGLRGIRIQA